jgi:hypothetical protein
MYQLLGLPAKGLDACSLDLFLQAHILSTNQATAALLVIYISLLWTLSFQILYFNNSHLFLSPLALGW